MNRELRSVSGVYAIVNRDSGKIYVGSAAQIGVRWNRHRLDLKLKKHHSIRLQRAWDKYGEGAFAFVVVRFCPVDDLLIEEQRWIDETDAAGPRGYNLCPTAGSCRGIKFPPERIAWIVASNTGRKRPLDAVIRTAEANRGKKRSTEFRAKLSAAKKGLKPSDETRAKMSEAHKGKKQSAETKAKKSAALKGRKLSPEHVAGIKKRAKGRKRTPESIARERATKRAKKLARMSIVQGEFFT